MARRGDGITRRGERWIARYRGTDGQEHARRFDRKVDAERWRRGELAKVDRGEWIDPDAGRITFAEWFARWSRRQVWQPTTLECARQAAGSVTFGETPMRAILPSHVQQWVKAMSQPASTRSAGLAPSTIRTRYNYVHMAMRAAVVDRVIPADPTTGVSLPRGRKASAAMTIPTSEQVGEALVAAPACFQPFIGVCAFAGLRLGEAAGLQLDDVDFLRRTIAVRRQVQGSTTATTTIVPPKYGSERVIYAPDDLITMLAEHVRRSGVRAGDWLISRDGVPFNRQSAGQHWRDVRTATGLDAYTLHDLRHFYASGLIAAGCDVVTVQRALGHSSATITLGVYSHLWPTAEDRTRAAAADLMAASCRVFADTVRTDGTS